MARPRADDWLESEVDAWKAAGVAQVVSLLEPEEVSELGLWAEADICRERGINFLSFPIPDRGIPAAGEARQIAGKLARDITDGHSVAIHCRAGIGRSSLMAACVLVLLGVPPDEALALIRNARGVPVPDTEEQRDWVVAIGNAKA